MSNSGRVVVVLVFGLICSVREAGSLTVTLPRADLSASTRDLLAEMVCGRPYKVAADTITGYSWASGLLGAYVSCQPHSQYQGSAVFGAAECKGREEKWTCDDRWLNLTFTTEAYPKSIRLTNVAVEEA